MGVKMPFSGSRIGRAGSDTPRYTCLGPTTCRPGRLSNPTQDPTSGARVARAPPIRARRARSRPVSRRRPRSSGASQTFAGARPPLQGHQRHQGDRSGEPQQRERQDSLQVGKVADSLAVGGSSVLCGHEGGGEGAMSQPPSPDARIATAPASVQMRRPQRSAPRHPTAWRYWLAPAW
jgi:hypothetical protein